MAENNRVSMNTVAQWAGIILAVAAGGVNTAVTATNPMGERVKALETDMATIKGEQQQRASMWLDVGEIKSDMRHVRGDLAELKDAVKELGGKRP